MQSEIRENYIFAKSTRIEKAIDLYVDEQAVNAQEITFRWGTHNGVIILPDDWFDFAGNGFLIATPPPDKLENPTYLFQIELFAPNTRRKKALFAIKQSQSPGQLEIVPVTSLNRETIFKDFWQTYETALEKGLYPEDTAWLRE